MENYRGLAAVYDCLVTGVDFEGWADYVEEILRRFGHRPAGVLDLACGTGNTLLPMALRGYEAAGVDLSPQMVDLARRKAAGCGVKIDYHVGDIRDFRLDRPVDLVTCFHDGLNYITEPDDLGKVFKNAAGNLTPGGMFIFDLNAVMWIGRTDPQPVVIDEENMTIIYKTRIDTGSALWTVDLTCFLKEGHLYRKFSETHRERGYEPEEVVARLTEAGFKTLAVYDAFTFNPPRRESRRHFYAARKEN
ncbi:MAG: methyltransferase domain-containing protein [Peptococcaceae bacterium]|nr:methyltransferase domain-containing protein [Peptococcaceae bacterium]